MAAKTTRKSLLGVTKETTAGTPVDPVDGTDVLVLQDGFSFAAAFNEIENNELSSSVDTKAPIQGLGAHTASISHYLRHSGVEATRPNYDALLEAAIGTVTAAPSEVNTTTASTSGDINNRAVIKLASGGSNFQRGSAILLKDSTNGYLVRNVYSVSSNDLTLLFNLGQAAPASGIGTGRHILYKASDSPSSLTLNMYWGNEAAREVMAGARVESATISAVVGEALNMELGLAATNHYFNPIRIDSDDTKLDFNLGASELTATVTSQLYASPHDLARTIETAMEATGASGTFTVAYNDTGSSSGKFTLQHSGSVFNLLWQSGTNTANTIGDAIGFVVSSNDTGATSYTSDNAMSWAAPYSVTADSVTNPIIVKNAEVIFGTPSRTLCADVQEFTLNIANTLQDVLDACATDGVGEKILVSRETTVDITATLMQHDSKMYDHFRQGDIIGFTFNGGTKTGSNWDAGKVVNVCIVEAIVSSYEVVDSNGIISIAMTLTLTGNASGLQNLFVNLL